VPIPLHIWTGYIVLLLSVLSCWQGKELAGTVTLIVTRRAALNFNHHIMLFGIVIITGSLVVVCYRVLKGKKKAVLAT
jgi:hypothetical protein